MFDDKKTKNIYLLTTDSSEKSRFSVLERNALSTRSMSTKEDCYALNKDSRSSKKQIDSSLSFDIDFAANR